jgi:hypothetical protein
MVHRRATVANLTPHLDAPPPFLDRMLTTTGVRGLFLPGSPPQRAEQPPTGRH